MKDLSNLTFFQKEFEQKEKMERYKQFKKEVLDHSEISVDDIVKNILKDFKAKTEFSAKEFYKLSKSKNNEKKILNFASKTIIPLWIKYVEKDSIYLFDLRDILNEDVYKTYLIGIYISIHSKNLEQRLSEFIELIVIEMFFMGIKAIKDKYPTMDNITENKI